jgi:hypothetical protein
VIKSLLEKGLLEGNDVGIRHIERYVGEFNSELPKDYTSVLAVD